MNILFVDKRYPTFGGISAVVTMLAKQFVADGHKVYVATLMPGLYEGIEELIPQGVSVIQLKQPTWNPKNIKILRSIVKENDIDVILNQWALHCELSFICNRARKGTKCKLISELHGAPDTTKMIIELNDRLKQSRNPLSRLKNKIRLALAHWITRISIRYATKVCDKYVLLSEGFIEPLISYAKLKKTDNICAIGNAIGISDEGFAYDFSKKKKQILYVGRMDTFNKRVNRIVEAWEQLFQNYPDWSLELVGQGPQLESLKEFVSHNHIERVHFHGFQKEPPRKFYEDASILLLTSDLEGFGLVIIEGMQFGVVPIVYGSYVAIYDILDNAKDGFITPTPYNAQNTIDALKSLMDSPEKRNCMAQAAINKSKNFSMDSIIEKWYKIMN